MGGFTFRSTIINKEIFYNMIFNFMKKKMFGAPLLIIAFVFGFSNPAMSQIRDLSDEIKEKLIKASPILGKKINANTFNGKPVLLTFFASW